MFRLDAVLIWETFLGIMPTNSHYPSHCMLYIYIYVTNVIFTYF